jgi:hypothetical protein
VTDDAFFRIVRGTPTAEEVAALVGALLRPGPGTPAAADRPARSQWRMSALPGARPASWKASALPIR